MIYENTHCDIKKILRNEQYHGKLDAVRKKIIDISFYYLAALLFDMLCLGASLKMRPTSKPEF